MDRLAFKNIYIFKTTLACTVVFNFTLTISLGAVFIFIFVQNKNNVNLAIKKLYAVKMGLR